MASGVRRVLPAFAALLAALFLATGASAARGVGHDGAGRLALCGNAGAPTSPVRHIIVVMLENESYPRVAHDSRRAPYETGVLDARCGSAESMYGTTHTSCANYIAATSGQFPEHTARSCSSGLAIHTQSLFSQLDAAGLTWKSYEEAMPRPCDRSSRGLFKNGHNPAAFFRPLASCDRDDVPDASLTGAGPLRSALASGQLPAFAFVTPNTDHDGEGPGGLRTADGWLRSFVGMVAASPAYQAGNVVLLVTYDEGDGPDYHVGENCADEARDLAGRQPSCHIPLFVVYPWSRARATGTFFDTYSITRTVENLYRLPLLSHAADPSTHSLLGHFGLPS